MSQLRGPNGDYLLQPVANYQPVLQEVSLSQTVLLSTYTALGAIIFTFWLSFGFQAYIASGPLEPLYGSTYYCLSCTYFLLMSIVAVQRLFTLQQSGPTKLCRLGLIMLFIIAIDYLICSNVLFTSQEVEDGFSDYHLQTVFIIVTSVVRMLSAALIYFLLRSALTEVAWDVGDPLS
ncbi:hypothetical protein TYRP_008195 [Tyrophagus putrescentiae]|nr:hypothetical protein TYRP_008195 [Tyrophagus putrescentiae]